MFLTTLALLVAVPSLTRADITVDAGRGPVTVTVPTGYSGQAMPLVVLLHGYAGNGASIRSYFGFAPLAESRGFFLVAPDGTLDGFGNRFWNATDACCDLGGRNVDDVGYLTDLVDAIDAQLNVDLLRIHFAGHSNGGFMSHRMACDRPDRIAAIASLAGAAFANPADCTPPSPVHVLQIHGTLDAVIQYGGGSLLGVPYPGAVVTTESWAGHASCSLTPDTSAPPLDLVATIPGSETSVTRYAAGCSPAGSAELWTMAGGSHSPSFTAQYAPLVVGFLLDHPKPGLVSSPAVTPSPIAGLIARPNPFQLRTELDFELEQSGHVTLAVYDVSGRRIRSLLAGETRSAGAYRASWDGTTDDGVRVGAGVYFVRMDVGARSHLRKIVVAGLSPR